MEALFEEARAKMTELLARGPNGRAVGAFEGAMYEAKGYYRPQADCIDVHAGRGRLLRRLQADHRAGHRPVHAPKALICQSLSHPDAAGLVRA